MEDWRDQYFSNPRLLVTIRNTELHRVLTDYLGIQTFATVIGGSHAIKDWYENIIFIDNIARRMSELRYPDTEDVDDYIEQRNAARAAVDILLKAIDMGAVSAIVLPE